MTRAVAKGGKLLIKPSQESVKRCKQRLAAVVSHLNPVIRGWSAYYRSVVSSRVFNGLDHHLWHFI